MKNTKNIKRMLMCSILAALSIVIYNFIPKFPLPGFPGFLEVNFSMLPIFIGLFILGWKEALVIVSLRFLLKLPMTSTAGVGETADLIIGIIVVLIVGFFNYKLKPSKNKDIKLYLISILAWIFAGIISNMISIPLYIKMYSFEGVYGMLKSIKFINEDNFFIMYILFAVIPFNLILSVIVGLVTYLVNLKLKPLYIEFEEKKINDEDKNANLN